jgi:hypothetical protein
VDIPLPPLNVGQPFVFNPTPSIPGQRMPSLFISPPFDLDTPRTITVTYPQIQYTQTVLLNFAGLTWPHVSVNTLVPADDIVVKLK